MYLLVSQLQQFIILVNKALQITIAINNLIIFVVIGYLGQSLTQT